MTVDATVNHRPQKHFALYVYAAGSSPKNSDPIAVSLCPQSRRVGEPLSNRWQAVTCPQCIGLKKTLRLDVA
jgi:hypothetical protein